MQRSPYACPCCEKRLYLGFAKNVVLHACGACRGIWLDKGDALRAFKGWAAETATALASRVDAGVSDAAGGYRSAARELGVRLCPHCRDELERRVTHTLSAAMEIDTCQAHGAWFDRGELVRVAESARDLRDESAPEVERYLSAAALFASLEMEVEQLPNTPAIELEERAERMRELLDALRENVKP